MHENIHKGHRERMKKRFLREGIDSFEVHNIIELLLFFGIPYKDTNEIAHRLLLRFGSVSNLFDATVEDIMQVEGVGENAATLIKLIPPLCRIYMTDKEKLSDIIDNVDVLGEFLTRKYIGVNVETVLLVLLDNSYRVISVETVFEGSVNSANISNRKLLELAILKNASMVVLAHNHPGGIAIPSMDDVDTTSRMVRLFDSIGAPLLEHILVAGDQYTPILYNRLGKRRLLPDASKICSRIDLDRFYGVGKEGMSENEQ